MSAFLVSAIKSKERRKGETAAAFEFMIIFRLNDKGRGLIILPAMQAIIWKKTDLACGITCNFMGKYFR